MTTPTTLTPAQINALVSTCAPYLDGLGTSYGYVPSLAAGIIFVLLFGLSLLGHVVQAVRTRQSIFILCAVGATSKSCNGGGYRRQIQRANAQRTITAEIIGWAGRLWSAKCPYNGVRHLSLPLYHLHFHLHLHLRFHPTPAPSASETLH